MLQFNNTHIFTGYLKQLMASTNIPKCKIYTQEFAQYKAQYGHEDPRVVESFNTLFVNEYGDQGAVKQIAVRAANRVNYLKTDNVFNYFLQPNDKIGIPDVGNLNNGKWSQCTNLTFDPERSDLLLTKTFKNTTAEYDIHTHEYLGDYLRFIRDYYNVNLMSLYNCFNNKVRTNIFYSFKLTSTDSAQTESVELDAHEELPENSETSEDNTTTNTSEFETRVRFDSRDQNYKLYAIPVKLFSKYTIAIDSPLGIEMFCTFYDKTVELSDKTTDLAKRTYRRVNHANFNQPIVYDALDVKFWTKDREYSPIAHDEILLQDPKKVARCDLIQKEKDLKLVLKVPATVRSSITILEGDYHSHNNTIYAPVPTTSSSQWTYKTNHAIHNFKRDIINNMYIKPISRLQLLAFNTGISYPFSDRLIEYLTGSAITPMDKIPDNILRVQHVMLQKDPSLQSEKMDAHTSGTPTKLPRAIRVLGVWENSMQKMLYDYMQNSGPFVVVDGEIVDKRQGKLKHFRRSSQSTKYDILGYVDKDTEECYASWYIDQGGRIRVKDTCQTIDIYNKLYDIK